MISREEGDLGHPLFRLVALAALVVLSARCDGSRCYATPPLHLLAPGGRASATRYELNCASPVEYPHVSLRLRESGQEREFILAEHLQVVSMRWTAAERLEIDYRNRTREIVRERLVRAGDDSVRVILRGLPERKEDAHSASP
ncbi:MAG: hypothetical protein ACYC0B_05855 [Gemmatimonadaceae bacterium]